MIFASLEAGATHETVIDEYPAVAVTPVGASGAPAGALGVGVGPEVGADVVGADVVGADVVGAEVAGLLGADVAGLAVVLMLTLGLTPALGMD